ncbi:MAG: D-alanyl-D-alanine carboxypeptidase/D-alanyl-D-alanine-endopeptidase [Nevskia sp.]|nr:D-alanyl-D-alanine carboxypeptidase/D-alanyl-D-alanine-endopeptidase [Nevskia sp.]
MTGLFLEPAGRALRRCTVSARLLGAAILLSCTHARADWQQLRALESGGAVVTAAALDLESGAMIEQLNAGTRLTPASLTKLAVAATALDVWPADKTFETRLLAAGPLRGGHIAGDLYLHGTGDSTFDHLALWSLAAQLKGAGVIAVDGRLVIDTAPFGPLGCETKDRCDALQHSSTAYNAPLSAVAVDYGNWCVDIRPTVPGSAAVVSTCGMERAPIQVEGGIKTVGPTARPTFWVDRVTTPAGEVLRAGGDVPVGNVVSVYRAMSDPALGTGLLLREVLHEIGIPVVGSVDVVHTPPPASAYTLAQNEGLSLKEQLGRMLRFSNNYVADMLTLNLAATERSQAPGQLSDAARSLSDFMVRIKSGGGTKTGAPPLFSGSGLTPENELSADDLVTLLAAQYRNTRNFPAFYGGLVVPRQAPFQFLRVGSPAWLDRVALKTGTMDDPHSVCGIAGYLRKKDGGWIAFAAIVNGGPRMHHVPLYKAMEAARADIDSLLARY